MAKAKVVDVEPEPQPAGAPPEDRYEEFMESLESMVDLLEESNDLQRQLIMVLQAVNQKLSFAAGLAGIGRKLFGAVQQRQPERRRERS